jgi:hypothetical protein
MGENTIDGDVTQQKDEVHAQTSPEAYQDGTLQGSVAPQLVQESEEACEAAKLGVNRTHKSYCKSLFRNESTSAFS